MAGAWCEELRLLRGKDAGALWEAYMSHGLKSLKEVIEGDTRSLDLARMISACEVP